MDGRWLGAMPLNAFLDQYVLATDEPLPRIARGSIRGDGVDTWSINMMKTALDEKARPTDDMAHENLPTSFSRQTRRQARNRTNQLQHTHGLWENSKALSQGSKCVASPTPEPSAKRHRGTPTAYGTQN